MKKKSTMSRIEGGLISAALGIAAGIALAPETGKKFGSDIKKKSAEFHARGTVLCLDCLIVRIETAKRDSRACTP
jgi:gas vesicle protein